MGKGISCIDPFALNTLIDVVKSSYLYQPSSTECAKNDPFNDWTISVEYFYEILSDFLDSISNETAELSFEDGDGDNTLTDTWEIVIQNILRDFIDTLQNEYSEISFIDGDGENTLIDIWETVLENLNIDITDVINNEFYELEFIDSEDSNTLTDYWVSELILERIIDTISNENYDLLLYDTDGVLYYDKDVDIFSDFIDDSGLDIIDESNDWDINIVDK